MQCHAWFTMHPHPWAKQAHIHHDYNFPVPTRRHVVQYK